MAGLTGPGELPVTGRTRHRRLREQGSTSRADLDAILAAGFVCHLGVLVDGAPMVVPTVYGTDGDTVYVHGSVASRSLVQAPQAPVCLTVTHVDCLVLARSMFEHGVNYRSAMIYGVPRRVTGEELLDGLRVLTEHAAPGQWDYARRPSRKELAATTLLALDLGEASVKIRTGPPDDGDSPTPRSACGPVSCRCATPGARRYPIPRCRRASRYPRTSPRGPGAMSVGATTMSADQRDEMGAHRCGSRRGTSTR